MRQTPLFGTLINSMNLKHSVKYGDQGFTLAESLIAMLLLVITMTGGMAYYYNANDAYYRGLHSRIAGSLADSKMETCKNLGAASIPGGACLQETATLIPAAIGGLNAKRTVNIANGPNGSAYKNVIVIVAWREPGEASDRNVTYETYVGP